MLITAVSAMIAVANNLTDGPQVSSNASWTFTNPSVGINVSNTALVNTANVRVLNAGFANIISGNIVSINTSTANITTGNITHATITNLWGTGHWTANANISGLLQVSNRMNVYSANIESGNIGTLAITTLSVSQLTVPVLNASFANITTLSVTGTSQHLAVIATLVTTDNCNVIRLNATTANITGMTFGTMNTGFSNTTSANIVSMNVGFANIVSGNVLSTNIAFMNVSNSFVSTLNATSGNITSFFANTGNILSCNIASGDITGRLNVASNPTSNLEVSTKAYTDIAANAFQVLYTAKGDILAASDAANAVKIAAGTNGQSLIADTNISTGVRWANRGPTQTFRGLSMGTSLADKVANGTQLVVYTLDETIMDDGEVVTGWTRGSVINLTASGAGGLDGGTANANTWYEVYAIRKRSDGTKNFTIHRALDRLPNQNTMNFTFWPTVAGATLGLGANNTSNLYTRLAQSFTSNIAGPLTSIEVRAYKTGATANGNVWLTLEANTAGSPAGTTLATSRKMDLARLAVTTASNLRFIFDTTANVSLATSYFWVFNSDYPASATLFANLVYSLANTDIGANGVNRGLPYGNTGSAWTQLTSIGTFIYKTYIEANMAAVTMPTGYDQKCLVSYAATDLNSKFKDFHQKDRTIVPYTTSHWATIVKQIQNPEVVDLLLAVPPITCLVSFTAAGASLNTIAYGRFHALDIQDGTVENQGGITVGTISFNTTVVPSPVIWIEQQAVLVKTAVAAVKLYPVNITF